MKNIFKNRTLGEHLVYTIIWLVVFLMPVFFSRYSDGINWRRVGHEWLKIIPFLVIFLIHNSLLFRLFFIHKKKVLYLVSVLLLVFGVSVITILIGREVGPSRGIIPSPPDLPRYPPNPAPFEGIPRMRIKIWQMLLFEDFMVSILVIGFNLAIKLTAVWQKEEQKNKELEKEKLQTELAFLRNQVSPHFFMNTLNNIHALIDINKENAKESVIKLSKLMRYLLYDSEKGKTTLLKEIEFIKSYVDLMRLRFSSNVKIELSFPENIPEVEIPPLLFTSLIENAFKHGVSYQSESFIGIFMELQEQQLFLKVKNSLNNKTVEEPGGLGLSNLEKRLGLIYGSDYNLTHFASDNFFEINIKIPVNGN